MIGFLRVLSCKDQFGRLKRPMYRALAECGRGWPSSGECFHNSRLGRGSQGTPLYRKTLREISVGWKKQGSRNQMIRGSLKTDHPSPATTRTLRELLAL